MGDLRLALRRFGAVCAGTALVLGPGCVSADLSRDPKTTERVVECLPTDTPAPESVASAFWLPNSRGFGYSDASPTRRVAGVLALAGGRLWFMWWNGPERHYDMERIIIVAQAETVAVERLGTSAMLVVQSRNLAYDSFELMNGGGLGSDPRATQELFEKLQAIRLRSPQAGP